MSDLLLMSPPGLPRNGLVALYDPYRDTYGRNVLPVGAEDFATGWASHCGAVITITPGQSDPWGGNTAYRIQTAGGTSVIKYKCSSGAATAVTGVLYPSAIWGKVNAGTAYFSPTSANNTPKVAIGESWAQIQSTLTGGSGAFTGICFNTGAAGDNLDITVCLPQQNLGRLFPYSTPAGAQWTLQTSLDYSGNGNHLTLGATTDASTDDPAFTGTAWSFDGGDFLTGGRPAQLEIAQPWWGFGVYYIRQSGNVECLVGKMNATGVSPGNKGFFVLKTNLNKIQLSMHRADGTRADTVTANVVAEGWHWVSYGWSGTQATLTVDGVDATPVAITDFTPDTTYNLTFGKYSHTNAIYFTGSLALAGFYSRYPSISELMRAALYTQGLMANRGVTLP